MYSVLFYHVNILVIILYILAPGLQCIFLKTKTIASIPIPWELVVIPLDGLSNPWHIGTVHGEWRDYHRI